MSLKKLLLLLVVSLMSLSAAAQVKVSGVVMSADDNQPIIGATVTLKGNASVGTATDLDGKFTLSVPSLKSRLVVTYVGSKTKEVAVTQGEMTVVLESSAKQLGEVVVTGMQKVDKRLFTGATTSIDASKAKLDGVADISRSLEGRAAGVSVQNVSGTFGTAPKIRVRGATSIYGSSKPLWVVDGVILEDNVELSADDLSSGDATTLIASAIAGLNADDIESFQVLKDGSATSIYGARAMAGVIVVTTKQGKQGHTTINYTGEFTMRLKPNYNDFNICNSQEQMGIYKEMESKGWLNFASLANSSSSGVYGTMYKLIDSYSNGHYGIANTTAAKNAYLREAEFRNTDWFDLLFNENITQNHSVSISGGTDKGRFYTSASIMNDPGWTLASKVNRYTFNANASYDLSKQVRVKLLTSDSYRKQKAPGTLSQDVDVVNGQVKRSFDINPYSYALNTSRTLDPNAIYTRNYADFNIFNELENNYIDLGVTDLKFQGELNWKPIEGLEFNAIGSFRNNNSIQDHYVKDNSNQAMAYRAGIDPENATIRASNPYLYTDPDVEGALPVSVLPKGGMLYHSVYAMSQYDFRATAQYNKTFDRKHITSVMGGYEASKIDRHSQSFDGWGIVYENGNIPFINWKLFKQQNEENYNYFSDGWGYRRNQAYFGTASYSFAGRYIVNGTLRYEGSNKLGTSHQSRWLPTWNVSGAWNVHEEPWFQAWNGNKVLSHAKLRLSYSLTADAGPSSVSNANAIYDPYQPWRGLTTDKELGLYLADIANSELTYEKKHEFDVGVDLGFFGNRVNLVFDWYKRNNYDLIGRIFTEGVGGVTSKYANVASMSSHGVEFTLSTRNIDTKDFNWTTDLTFSYATNKITDLQSRSRIIDLVQGTGFPLQGYPVRAIFSIPFAGLDSQGLPQFYDANGNKTTTGIYFQEFEKIGFLKYEGPVDPTTTGGLNNSLSYKGFHLNLFVTYSFGNKIRLTPVFAAAYSDLSALPKEFKNRWVMPGDEAYTDIPTIASRRQYYNISQLSIAYNAYNYSTARIADGGFVRMKEIALTYDIPKLLLKFLHLNTASVKLTGTNLFLLYSDSKLNGQDPEFFNSGGVATPSPKQFTFTLRFGL
jgi:TonB-linked SusC/RagA family outer membrane protein